MGFLSVARMWATATAGLHGACQPIRASDHAPVAAGVSPLQMLMTGARSYRGEHQAPPTVHALRILHVPPNTHPQPAFCQTYMESASTVSRPRTGWRPAGYLCVAYAAGVLTPCAGLQAAAVEASYSNWHR
jgi:hypothetical protein